jgi:hypothetical protein
MAGARRGDDESESDFLARFVDQIVVLDLRSAYVCLGKLARIDAAYFELRDADLHDLRDSAATRETYVYESALHGIRRNRALVLIRRAEVVAISRLEDVSES